MYASGLLQRGLRQGDRVALLLGNTYEFVITYYAAARAGLVAVTLNPAYTSSEVAVLLADSDARILLVQPATHKVGRSPPPRYPVARSSASSGRNGRASAGRREGTELPFDDTTPDTLALLLFTAGTSGRPKGAMLTHGALRAAISTCCSPFPSRPLSSTPTSSSSSCRCSNIRSQHGSRTRHSRRRDVRSSTGSTRLSPCRSSRVRASPQSPVLPACIRHGAPPDRGTRCRRFGCCQAADRRCLPECSRSLQNCPVWRSSRATDDGDRARSCNDSCPVFRKRARWVARRPGLEIRLVESRGRKSTTGDPGEVWVRGLSVFSGYWPGADRRTGRRRLVPIGRRRVRGEDGDLHVVDRRREVILVNGFNVSARDRTGHR